MSNASSSASLDKDKFNLLVCRGANEQNRCELYQAQLDKILGWLEFGSVRFKLEQLSPSSACLKISELGLNSIWLIGV